MNVLDDAFLRLRLPPAPTAWSSGAPRLAAVLVPWFACGGEDFLLFTVRRADLRQHAGQVSFPGGMRQGDEDPVQCALRESAEEIGLRAEAATVLGGLPARTSSSGIAVHAVVARIPEPAALVLQAEEVARVLTVPWRDLAQPLRWSRSAPPGGVAGPPSPHFEHQGERIWGLTGRFCDDLVRALTAT